MKIALAQMRINDDLNRNYEKSIDFIKKASKENADLICFSEIQLSPFFPQYEKTDVSKYILDFNSKYIKGIQKASNMYNIYSSPNFYIKENNKLYDMSLLIDDSGKIIGKQKMVHIAQCDKFYEQSYYTPSEEGFNVFNTKFGKIGIVVCFDRHYPESIRTSALKGAELIIIPTANTTSEPEELFKWEINVQAFQNSVNIAMCNRVGIEDQMEFSGKSMVSDYNGNTVKIADNKEQLLFANINLENSTKTRKIKPYFDLRNKEFYL
ncbi:amidohydrolase [Methanobrevibacter sp. 87.7]|uniref:carbon-nitrogen hydrolase family protein n=1 Tax=Methanobrevibacter sp. 87.7 TaxID=387957 RepID=UPI000B506645|nr:carbon-nitrogen hydrolase family protein [Methanobrevibacter sp. 87.7]OWT32415.1 amidohydrolase [Methanobrevibacter sp. 87.7]